MLIDFHCLWVKRNTQTDEQVHDEIAFKTKKLENQKSGTSMQSSQSTFNHVVSHLQSYEDGSRQRFCFPKILGHFNPESDPERFSGNENNQSLGVTQPIFQLQMDRWQSARM